MRDHFLKFSFATLLSVLWAIFATCTGLTYWTPMRAWPRPLPFTISPLEWIAVGAYIAFLGFVTAHRLSSVTPSHVGIWGALFASAILFAVTAIFLEYKFYFNAGVSEKSETGILVFGFSILAFFASAIGSYLLGVFQKNRSTKFSSSFP